MRTKGNFEILEQSLGVNFNPDGILFDPSCPLKPVSSTMLDWLHVYLVNGLFQIESSLFMPVVVKANTSHAQVCLFLKSFTAPRDQKSNLKAAIETLEKSKAKEAWKPSASDVLSVYPLLRLLVLESEFKEPQHKVMAHSFLSLCHVVDLLSMLGKDKQVEVNSLELALKKHCVAFLNAHGPDSVVPKFHYAQHLADLLRKHGLLLSCFTHERKHKVLKQFANQVHNAGDWFEHSILREVTHNSMLQMERFQPRSINLENGKPCEQIRLLDVELQFLRATPGSQVGTACTILGMNVHRGDVVLTSEGQVVQVVAFASLRNQILALVTSWTALGKNRFRPAAETRWIEAKRLCIEITCFAVLLVTSLVVSFLCRRCIMRNNLMTPDLTSGSSIVRSVFGEMETVFL